jgi:hypothetical protein
VCCFVAGYNYYGTERLYSGVNGKELEADIFIGVVYYQRLRHMVSDKFQVCLILTIEIVLCKVKRLFDLLFAISQKIK